MELDHLCKAYGDKTLIKDFTYIFLKMTGLESSIPMAAGKSTLDEDDRWMGTPDKVEPSRSARP